MTDKIRPCPMCAEETFTPVNDVRAYLPDNQAEPVLMDGYKCVECGFTFLVTDPEGVVLPDDPN